MDLIDLFDRGTQWTATKIPAAVGQLGARTPCDQWTVRTVLNHMLDSMRYFGDSPNDSSAPLPDPDPPEAVGDDPVKTYEEGREATLRVYREPGVIERTGPSLGIAFVDQLVHGWDIARATGQDATMPDDLAHAAFQMVDGRMPPEKRGNAFKPEIKVADDSSAQEKLLAYTGRQP